MHFLRMGRLASSNFVLVMCSSIVGFLCGRHTVVCKRCGESHSLLLVPFDGIGFTAVCRDMLVLFQDFGSTSLFGCRFFDLFICLQRVVNA